MQNVFKHFYSCAIAVDGFEFHILLIDFEAKLIKFLTDLVTTCNAISSKTVDSMHNLRTVSKTVFTPLMCRITFRMVGIVFGLLPFQNPGFVHFLGSVNL